LLRTINEAVQSSLKFGGIRVDEVGAEASRVAQQRAGHLVHCNH